MLSLSNSRIHAAAFGRGALQFRQASDDVLTLSRTAAENWCVAHGVLLDGRRRPDEPACAARFDIPEDAGRRIGMVAERMAHYESEPEILVWFTEWGVWPSGERPHIFTRLRASYGENRPLIETPGHVFQRLEQDDAISFVTLGVLFLWAVYVVGGSGNRLVHYSHDEVGWSAL